eukprot:CAMPEP_0185729894 /NCGR_PEP_ID=MMETSP1171-20130828/7734_1 /TAXON_ID=374046 /ORGANISM="Helicotheca tamensis, Strain CCMP826" /LENGTH=238 /DNA_ID=CAMNT_0028398833 /DNA_START=71 /DNA_END=787 /DNA_ORIENTATION=+
MAEAGGSTMPTDEGMALYLKAGPNPSSIGDCPFAHYVRIVLAETKTPYEAIPCNKETKPKWLIENHNGALPALRHSNRCIVESDVIADYVNSLNNACGEVPKGEETEEKEAKQVTDGFFPAMAKYMKHTPDGDDDDEKLKCNLEAVLQRFETYLTRDGRKGPFWVGDGMVWTMLDCSLVPKLYHMKVGLKNFKKDAVDLEKDYPGLASYVAAALDRESVKDTLYPEETVVWGWSNARL